MAFLDLLPALPWEGPPLPKKLVGGGKLHNPHGSLTLTPFKVKSIDESREVSLTGIADTGSIYSAIPVSVVNELGLPYIGDAPVILLDGKRVTAKMFMGIIEIDGKKVGTTFLSLGDGFIAIGVTDLEKLGFKVNPATGTLEPTEILG